MSLGLFESQALKCSMKWSPEGGLGMEPMGVAGEILSLLRDSDMLFFSIDILLISINNQSEGIEKYLRKQLAHKHALCITYK